MTKTAFAFILACCLSSFSSYGQAAAFKTFINSIEDESTLIPSLVKDFVKITAIEELEDKSSLELLDFKRTRNFYGLLIGFENKMKCQMAYFVTLDRSGMMIDFTKTTEMCEIDLDAQRHNTSEGTLDGDIIAIMKEEEVVIDLSDTSASLDNATTELTLYFQYFEIQSNGFLMELSAPKTFIEDREYVFASMELLREEDLSEYSRSELQDIKNEILASYGQIFESKRVQDYFDEQPWYTAVGEVGEKLTDIEKRNIALINKLLLN